MKMNFGKTRFAVLAAVVGAGLLAVASPNEQRPNQQRNDEPVEAVLARVPVKARAKRNPLENDPEAVDAGRKLFAQHCAECHGESAGGSKRGPSLRADPLQTATPGEALLDRDKRRCSPRHAGVVETSRASTLADRHVSEILVELESPRHRTPR